VRRLIWRSRLGWTAKVIRSFGLRGVWIAGALGGDGGSGAAFVRLPGVRGRLELRRGTSDVHVLEQVFMDEQYALSAALRPTLILDLGAYIGLASVYFAERWPEARIIAVEPHPESFALLERNVAAYPQVRAVRAAVWDSRRRLGLVNPGETEWGYRFADAAPGAMGADALTIGDFLADARADDVVLVKLDVEGAEREALAASEGWMPRIRALMVEVHEGKAPGARAALSGALARHGFARYGRGEVVVAARASTLRSAVAAGPAAPPRPGLVARIRRLAGDADDRRAERGGPIRVLFLAYNGFGFTCQLPVLRAIGDDPRFHVRAAFVEDGPLATTDPAHAMAFERARMPLALALASKWHVVVHSAAPGEVRFQRRAIHVSLPHGGAFGNTEYAARLTDGPGLDVLFGLSSRERAYVERQRGPEVFAPDGIAFTSVGCPALDALARGELPRDAELARLGLPIDRPSVLALSTWSKESLFGSSGADAVRALAERLPHVSVIATGHSLLWAREPGLEEALVALARRHENLRFVRTTNAIPLLAAADVLVGDHSSILPMFSVLGRPIVRFASERHWFHDDEVRAVYEAASLPFRRPEEAPERVEEALRRADELRPLVEGMRDYFFDHIGRSAERARDALLALGAASSTASPRWRDARAALARLDAGT